MIYYITDTHYGHENVLKFDNRPFDNIYEMDQYMINEHNNIVKDNDDIYFIGDFAYRNKNSHSWYLKRLKGKKHLIIGNHDVKLLKDNKNLAYFETIEKMQTINDGDKWVVLCHYPILEWYGTRWGYYHVHGHIHNRINNTFNVLRYMDMALNAGAPIIGYKPCTLEQIIEHNNYHKERPLEQQGN